TVCPSSPRIPCRCHAASRYTEFQSPDSHVARQLTSARRDSRELTRCRFRGRFCAQRKRFCRCKARAHRRRARSSVPCESIRRIYPTRKPEASRQSTADEECIVPKTERRASASADAIRKNRSATLHRSRHRDQDDSPYTEG